MPDAVSSEGRLRDGVARAGPGVADLIQVTTCRSTFCDSLRDGDERGCLGSLKVWNRSSAELERSARPDPDHISTSYVERQNWSVRTSMRRYTRLSNGFSRKIENHMAAVAINYFAYNFIKIHRTLRVTPAMAAGVTGRLFDVTDLVNLLIEVESKKAA